MAICRTFTSAAALVFCATTAFAQAPANDECGTATALALGLNSYDATGATDSLETVAGATCGVTTIFQDVWFTFTPPTTDSYDFETIDGGFGPYDTKLVVYNTTACPADELNIIDCVDDGGGPGFLSLLTGVPLTAGVDVLVRVGAFSAGTVIVPLDITISVSPPPPVGPANDDCVNATTAVLGLNPFDSRLATDGIGLALDVVVCDMGPFGDEQIYQDVWFDFTPAMTGFYDFESTDGGVNPTFDSRIAVYNQSTCPDDPNLVIACDDDSGGPGFQALTAGVSLTMGNTVLVRVGSYSGFTTEQAAFLDVRVGVAPPLPPTNDDCINATVAMLGITSIDNTLASNSGFDQAGATCGFTSEVGADLWYTFTPATSGQYDFETLDNGLGAFDTKFTLYDNSTPACPPLVSDIVDCNDDGGAGLLSLMSPILTGGTEYLLRVGGFGSSTGAVDLSITSIVGPGPMYPESCFGDGGDQMGCTNCPCGNEAPIGSGGGCLNSAGTGVQLIATGDASVSLPSGDTTDLRFAAAGAPPTAFCILNSGDAVAPGNPANPCFGLNSGAQAAAFDGLRCAITNTRRHGGRSADANGDVGVTNNPWGGEGGPPVGIAVAGGGFVAGQTRIFQIINRDDALAVCMRALNTSQAVEVTFLP